MPAMINPQLENFDIWLKYLPLSIDNNGNIIRRTIICPNSTPILNDKIWDRDKLIFDSIATSCNFVDKPKPWIKPNINTIKIKFGGFIENHLLKPSKFSKPL